MDKDAIDDVIRRSLVCRLAMADGDQPYVVPVSFGYDGRSLYFHGRAAGKKIEMLKRNSRVCFEFDVDVEIVPKEKACGWGLKYRSVIGTGRATFIEDHEQKARALNAIMRQYAGRDFDMPDDNVRRATVLRVDIDTLTGKQAGY